ncbi:homeobox protein ESX1-like [Suricata suricatta]|uniref:homeobox protein ESX1-like n=1 Tax=Suricata suricatta TaxID=37032 RepID=UPI0011558D21|nr:homeobox protein ESX1-like [Suricata suricatta]
MEPLKPEVTGFPSLGVNENHQEEPREIKQEEMSPPRNGAAGEAGAEFARLLAAAAIKVKKERNSDGEEVDEIGAEGAGNFGAVYPRSVVPETRDVGCGRSPQLLEIRDPRQEGQVPQEAVQEPVQPRRQRRGPRILFNPWQVYHLESFFQRNQYPNTFMR